MAMGSIGPGRRRNSNKVMTEIHESTSILPVIEVVVTDLPAHKHTNTQTHGSSYMSNAQWSQDCWILQSYF